MGLRNEIAQEPVVNEIIIENEGSKYKLRGSPDASLMAGSLLLSKDRVSLMARHWSAELQHPVAEAVVKHIYAVHATLVPEEWEITEAEPNGEWVLKTPYDIVEIARFQWKKGPTFLKLVPAAFNVLGLSQEEGAPTVGSAFDKVAAGNSEVFPDSNLS